MAKVVGQSYLLENNLRVTVLVAQRHKTGTFLLGCVADDVAVARLELSVDEATFLAEQICREVGRDAGAACRKQGGG